MADFNSSRDAGQKAPALVDRVGASTTQQVRGQYNTGATGIITGGELAAATGGPAHFMVEAGEGWIRNSTDDPEQPQQYLLQWPEMDEIDPINKGSGSSPGISYVWASIPAVHTASGTTITAEITQTQPSDYPDPGTPDPAEFRSKVRLGFVVYVPGPNIILGFVTNVRPARDVAAQFGDLADGLGSLRVWGGDMAPLLGTLSMSQAAGRFFALGCNWTTSEEIPHTLDWSAVSPLLGGRGYRAASGGMFDVTAGPPSTTLDPTLWDDGSGTPQAVPTGKATIQSIWFNPVSPGHVFMYGQTVYDSLSQAILSMPTAKRQNVPQLRAEGWVMVAEVAVLQSATDLADTTMARVYDVLPNFRMSGDAVSVPPAYINGLITDVPKGSGSTYANFASNATPGVGCVTFPVDVFITAVTFTWLHTSTISIGAGESIDLDLGVFVPGSSITGGNFTIITASLTSWDNADTGTHPISVIELNPPYLLPAGTPLGARSTEVGTVSSTQGDVSLTVQLQQ